MGGILLHDLLEKSREVLKQAGHDNVRLDVRILAEFTLGIPPIDQALEGNMKISFERADLLMAAVMRRKEFEPISQITGEKEFWSLSFKVTKDTLTPRPDSETLIEAALREVQIKEDAAKEEDAAEEKGIFPKRILDLGTGTGCLLLSLLSEFPLASGLGIDVSQKALEVAKFNGRNLKLSDRAEFKKSDWFENIPQGDLYDIIVSNPPYIAYCEKNDLPRDVKDYEPEGALFAKEEGLKDYKLFAGELAQHLTSNGFAILEFGYKQAADVKNILKYSGAKKVNVFKDLSGNDRIALIYF